MTKSNVTGCLTRHIVLPLSLVASLPFVATAQGNPRTREGFWISFGLGGGSLAYPSFYNERTKGLNLKSRLGGTLSRRLLIGAEWDYWMSLPKCPLFSFVCNETETTVTNVGPVLIFYPRPQEGFFLKGGLSRTSFKVQGFSNTQQGVGLTLGLGYDIGRNFALTPYLDLLGSFDKAGSRNLNKVSFGLGFTWP